MKQSARQAAFDALLKVEESASYSNLTLDHILSESSLSDRDKGFASRLFYGVLEKKLLLDYNIAVLSFRSPEKLEDPVRVILRMGLYQLWCLKSVPAPAAVNESVELCKANGCNNACSLVNGLLRAASRQKEPRLPEKRKSKNKYYSVKYSCPEPIIKLWRQSYGDENTLGQLEALEGRPPLCIRVNTLKTTAQELNQALENEGTGAEVSQYDGNCLILSDTGAVEALPGFREGLFHVQDMASQLCCRILSPKQGQTLLDVCSAPGGKSFTCAELMENKGRIVSCDLYSSRLRLVRSGADRLSVDIIDTVEADASELELDIKADRVLCDVPCSGLGIIRRKPELRYKKELGLEDLPQLQYRILCRAASFLKSGGLLVYSTCTLHPAENSGVIRRFLSEHEDFCEEAIVLPDGIRRGIDERKNELTLFSHLCGTDGFFISLVRRK